MKIVINEQHTYHDCIGRLISKDGENHLSYWEGQKIRPIPDPFDDKENPDRVISILRALRASHFGTVQSAEDHGLEPIFAVHDASFIQYLQTAYERTATETGIPGPVYPKTFAVRNQNRKPDGLLGLHGYYAFDVYTPIIEGTWHAAYWSAQCGLTAARYVEAGERVAYAICRPSGHHATRDLYGGYCFLNNAAIAARYLQGKNRKRVAILDIDFHHGNGTQTIFYDDPSVLFCSLHGEPEWAFPYFTGYKDENGIGEGMGFNHNWPLPRGTNDIEYLHTLEYAISEIRKYEPQFLVISAGFDIAAGDPYGGFNITTQGIQEIGKSIAKISKYVPTVILQEGGYVADKLGEYVLAFIQAFDAI